MAIAGLPHWICTYIWKSSAAGIDRVGLLLSIGPVHNFINRNKYSSTAEKNNASMK